MIAILIGCIYIWVVNFSYRPPDEISRKIDSLNVKVDSIRRANDSIKINIDTTEIEIKHVYEKYIEIRNTIITQSVDSDCIFFSRYLSEDSQRYIDTINFEPIETY